MQHTRVPAPVPVLVVGGGTVGLAAALFLARQGVETLVVERQDGPSEHPRATGVGPRTIELLRELGLLEEVNAVAIDAGAGNLGMLKADTLATASAFTEPPAPAAPAPAGAPGADPQALASPWALRGTCPQNRLDAVLLRAARRRGVTVAYRTELLSFTQDRDGVTAVLLGPDGRREVRADYLVAADGVRSPVRSALGIPMSGVGAIGYPNVNILFRADLSRYTGGRTFVGCQITNPASPSMLMQIDGEREWVLHAGYDPEAGGSAGDFTPERCRELVHAAVGGPLEEVEVVSVLPWRVRAQLADRFSDGRVFLVGDAAHAIPPMGAFGMNTGIADAHNLAWKLALVLRGSAVPELLESYDAERRPVGALAVEQARLRLDRPHLHWDRRPHLAAERARAGIVNAPIVHLGYRYDSAAVIGPVAELPSIEDLLLDLDGSPGSRLPHLWVELDGVRTSTLELVGSGFTVLAGPDGAGWAGAAEEVAGRLGLDLHARSVDAPQWPAVAGAGRGGALLVRPDGFVAWRATDLAADPAGELERVLVQLLGMRERRADGALSRAGA
ncbi:FAD-dependent oxidoreductase [Kitasatospora viridis]|uniref:2-polyprenyl-6-methoxyphenol hydroxylase-like FAD-dependent oxidoreductase n=1 Tax=Kitasatospora viridis TaxID=281105 RepID=A0A561T724_9ACTN|nr:FAD-dependent oxidoreductase [Kitasatospora viridis]TWF82926.1 2-polyprenyl-6-methoxyphenol hydroxylase-like FAD-dependent oxidoreductase [Kitasatospora viridis]